MTERCKHGHPWNKANTKWMRHSVNGLLYRQCRACAADIKRKRYATDPAYREAQIARVKKAQAAARQVHAAIMNMVIGAPRENRT